LQIDTHANVVATDTRSGAIPCDVVEGEDVSRIVSGCEHNNSNIMYT